MDSFASPSQRQDEYRRYADHCLKMVAPAPNREDRVIQREMAAEWLKLADAIPVNGSQTGH